VFGDGERRPRMPDSIETDRLVLRPYADSDARTLLDVSRRNKAHLSRFESDNLIMGIDSEDRAIEIITVMRSAWDRGEYYFVAMFEKQTGAWAGQVYVAPTDPTVPEFTIGYVADVDHEGRGFVSEAVRAIVRILFRDLDAHRIRSDCNEHNERSWKLLERCGFTREGHLRDNRRGKDGKLHGDYLYGLLRREFEDR
jgi:RimJ/RimL family protein N-acetyltransferase